MGKRTATKVSGGHREKKRDFFIVDKLIKVILSILSFRNILINIHIDRNKASKKVSSDKSKTTSEF